MMGAVAIMQRGYQAECLAWKRLRFRGFFTLIGSLPLRRSPPSWCDSVN
jgi:hypothetical protein